MVPISAHALFARPMVVSPRSVLAAEVIGVAGAQQLGATPVSGQQASTAISSQSVAGHSETAGAVLWCDGRRMVELPPGSRVEVRRGSLPVLLARLPAAATGAAEAGAGQIGADEKGAGAEVRIGAPFTDRLVVKFGLPVAGWRGQPSDRLDEDAADNDGVTATGAGNGRTAKGGAVTAKATAASDEMGEDTLAREEFSNRADEEPGGHA